MMVIIDIRKVNLLKYPYSTTKLGKLFFPRIDPEQEDTKVWESFKVDDRYFGGNIDKIAEIKDKPFFIIADKNSQTIGILHKFDKLQEYTLEDLKDLAGMFRIEGTTKKDIINGLLLLQT